MSDANANADVTCEQGFTNHTKNTLRYGTLVKVLLHVTTDDIVCDVTTSDI